MSETNLEAELQTQITELRRVAGLSETKPEDDEDAPPVENMYVLTIPEEALIWMHQCEIANQTFRSELEKRIRSDQQVTYVPEGDTLTMLCEGKMVFSAKRTLLGLHSYKSVKQNDQEVLVGGIAPGNYHTWAWPWAVYDDDPRSQEIKPQVDQMEELEHHRKEFTMFEDRTILQYILAVLVKNMGFEHVLPISPQGSDVDHIFGLKEIRFSELKKDETS